MSPEQAVELLSLADQAFVAILAIGTLMSLSLGFLTGRRLAP